MGAKINTGENVPQSRLTRFCYSIFQSLSTLVKAVFFRKINDY